MSNKIAIVTGAARGLGQGICIGLASKGYRVICVDLAGADETVSLATAHGGVAESVILDITNSAEVDRVIAEIGSKYGHIEVLVNNAGLYTHNEVADTADADLHRIFAVNVFGTFYLCRAVIPYMKKQKFGRIINMASQVGKVARPGDAVYAASKGGVVLMTQALALELGVHNITANAICPGTIWTPMAEQALAVTATEKGITIEEAKADYIEKKIPVGRYGTPEDVANLVCWLASDEASFVTGSSQNLSGGEQVFF